MANSDKILSPGVFTNEIDETFLPSAIGDIGAVVIGPTVKGPTLTPTIVNSYSEFQAMFGDTFQSGSSVVTEANKKNYTFLTSLTAKEYLRHKSPLTVVRVLAGSYSHASATISSSIDPAVVGGGVHATGSITLVDIASGSGLAAPIISSASFSPYLGDEVKFLFTGSDWKPDANPNSATSIYVVSGSTLAASAINLRDVLNNSSSLHGLSLSASLESGAIVGLTASNPGNFGVFSTDISNTITPTPYYGGSNDNYGGGNVIKITGGGFDWADFTSQSMAGGKDFNDDVFKTSFKLHTLADGDIMNSGDGVYLSAGSNNLLKSGSIDNLRWEMTSLNKKRGTFSLIIRRGSDTSNRKETLETWSNLNLDPNSNNYIAKVIGDQYLDIQDSGTDYPYIKAFGNYPNKSKYVRVEVIENTIDYLDEVGAIRDGAASSSLPTFASGSNSGSFAGSFSGGSDGTVAAGGKGAYTYENISENNSQGLDPSDDGTSGGYNQYIDALNLLKNQDEYDFNLLMMPGIIDSLHSGVCSKAVEVCEDRADCFVLLDPVIQGSNPSNAITEADTRDSSYAAMYWPWVQMPDNQLGKNVWVPPSVAVAGVYAFNDTVSHEWFAPAGLNRGRIPTATTAERILTQSNRDDLYDANVNPIATFPGTGVVVYGQKTLQKKSSALDRINVRRLMIKLKKFIASSSRFLVFEQNTSKSRKRFLSIVNPFLEDIKSKSGLNEFRVVMDETNNTPDVIDRNILYGQIFVQPTRTAEFVVLDFTVQPTGATFGE